MRDRLWIVSGQTRESRNMMAGGPRGPAAVGRARGWPLVAGVPIVQELQGGRNAARRLLLCF
ncbi:MAG: hypothetical protein WAW52_13495 [Methanothrix sp.]